MKKSIISIAVLCARIINLIFKPLKLRNKIAIISRQSDVPTLDIQMLDDRFKKSGIKTVILTKKLNKSISGMFSYALHLISQMYHIATSKVVILDGYCILVSILPKKKNQKVIQMWHALGAIKKFGWQNVESPDGHSREIAEVMKMHNNYDYVLTPSRITGEFFAEAFRVQEEKLVLCGLPRIDYIRSQDEKVGKSIFDRYPEMSDKTGVLYVPTFRKNSELDLKELIARFDFDRFAFIIKKHFLDKGDYSWAEKAGAIVDTEFSSMDWLRVCDKVITDYSAIAFEAAIADKDIYIYQPDSDEYENNVGLNIALEDESISDYVCRTESELFKKLAQTYDHDAMIKFREKYIEIDLNDCTGQLRAFAEALLHE